MLRKKKKIVSHVQMLASPFLGEAKINFFFLATGFFHGGQGFHGPFSK